MNKPIGVLLIEDSEDDAILILREFKRCGYAPISKRVDSTKDLETALQEQAWDVIISDHNMPQLTSVAALSTLQKTSLDLPFIIVSGAINDETATLAMKAGARDLILKDKLNRLVPAVERELEEAKTRKDKKQKEESLQKTEQAFKEQTAIFNSVFMSMGDGMVVCDENGKSILWNPAAEQILGGSPGKIPLDQWAPHYKIYLPDIVTSCPTEELPLTQALQGKKVTSQEIFLRRSNLPVEGLWLSVTANPLMNEESHIKGAVAIFQDITERKRLEEQVRQKQKMESVGQLAGGIAHDFNNILMVILGSAGFLSENLADISKNDQNVSDVEAIKKAASKATTMTRQLLAFSRKQVLELKVIDINTSIKGLEKILMRLIGEDIEFETLLDSHLEKMKADPGQIEQVIMNLVVNARDSMKEGGKIIIETKNIQLDASHHPQVGTFQPGPFTVLRVNDTGSGMDNEIQARIFEPFFTTKGKDKGTGMGLATVYGIVTQSGGNIRVESEPGRGTTFSVYFPVTKDGFESADDITSKAVEHGTPATILLVEDDEEVLKIVRRALGAGGKNTVLEAHHGQEALQIARERKEDIDLLITDIIMPQMSGLELTRQLAPLHPETKTLLISGYADKYLSENAEFEPGIKFLPKPFSQGDLLRKINEVLCEQKKAA